MDSYYPLNLKEGVAKFKQDGAPCRVQGENIMSLSDKKTAREHG